LPQFGYMSCRRDETFGSHQFRSSLTHFIVVRWVRWAIQAGAVLHCVTGPNGSGEKPTFSMRSVLALAMANSRDATRGCRTDQQRMVRQGAGRPKPHTVRFDLGRLASRTGRGRSLMFQPKGPGSRRQAGMKCHQAPSARPRWHLQAAATAPTSGFEPASRCRQLRRPARGSRASNVVMPEGMWTAYVSDWVPVIVAAVIDEHRRCRPVRFPHREDPLQARFEFKIARKRFATSL